MPVKQQTLVTGYSSSSSEGYGAQLNMFGGVTVQQLPPQQRLLDPIVLNEEPKSVETKASI